jgi:hypothetical protein
VNDEYFHQHRDGVLDVLNVQKKHSGFYSCLIHFTSFGAKLKTPHEKLNIFAGELRNFIYLSSAFLSSSLALF